MNIIIPNEHTLEQSYAARELGALVSEQYGIACTVICGKEPTEGDACVILSTELGDSFDIRTCGGCLYVSAGSAYGYEAAVKSIRDLQGRALTDSIALTGSGKHLRTCTAAESGHIRFMTYNVYGWNNSSHNTTAFIRQPFQISLLRSYGADILALQEFSGKWYRSGGFIRELESLGYVEAGHLDENYTPVFYRPSVLELEDSGYRLFVGPNDKNSKSVSWAVFRTRDGKRFAAMSTHFMWNDKTLDAGMPNATRCLNARELLEVIAELFEKHGELPLIFGGDLNCSEGRGDAEPLRIISQAGFTWSQGYADANGCAVNSVNGHGADVYWDSDNCIFADCPSHSSRGCEYSIDHVFHKGISIERFATVTDRFACFSSDHSPKIVDFLIK